MLRNLTFCLAVAGIGFGIATGSAAAVDREQSKVSGASSLVPAEGKFSSGFSAIKSQGLQNLKGGSSGALDAATATRSGLARPEGEHAWTDGRVALKSGFSSNLAISDPQAQDALAMPHGLTAANPKGLAALKSLAGKGAQPSQALQGAGASSVAGSAVPDSLLSRPPK
jgi:hypothetical protein